MANAKSDSELPRDASVLPGASSYVSYVLDLPPLVAVAAFDAQTSSGLCAGEWSVEVAGGRLEMRPPVAVTDGSGSFAYRAQRAHLVSGWRHAPVELELMPWSGEGCELGLRALGRLVPSRASLTNAEVLLRELAGRMQRWGEASVHDALETAVSGDWVECDARCRMTAS